MPGHPGEPGKEGKRVSKQRQIASCVAWLVVVLTERTWPGEKARQQLNGCCCFRGGKDDLWQGDCNGPAKGDGLVCASCMTINEWAHWSRGHTHTHTHS